MSFGQRLDLSLNSMEETRFLRKHSDLLDSLTKELHFTKSELEHIFLIYYKFKKANKSIGMSKDQFRDILHDGLDMTDDILMARIMYSLHRSPTMCISMETWARALSLFLRGTLNEKIAFCFSVYDVMGDGMLNRETIFYFLRTSLLSQSGEDDAEESVKDMLEVITKKMDLDRDGRISFTDYEKTVLNQPKMLEVFGQCIPTRNATFAFLTTFSNRIKNM